MQGLIDFNYATIRTTTKPANDDDEPGERTGKGKGKGKGQKAGSSRLIQIDTGARLFQFRAESAASARTWVEELLAFQQRVALSDVISSAETPPSSLLLQGSWTSDVISM